MQLLSLARFLVVYLPSHVLFLLRKDAGEGQPFLQHLSNKLC